jgi:hypothetical protein
MYSSSSVAILEKQNSTYIGDLSKLVDCFAAKKARQHWQFWKLEVVRAVAKVAVKAVIYRG